jgi:hypothetical protein
MSDNQNQVTTHQWKWLLYLSVTENKTKLMANKINIMFSTYSFFSLKQCGYVAQAGLKHVI